MCVKHQVASVPSCLFWQYGTMCFLTSLEHRQQIFCLFMDRAKYSLEMEDHTNPFVGIMGLMSQETTSHCRLDGISTIASRQQRKTSQKIYRLFSSKPQQFLAVLFTHMSGFTDYWHEEDGLGLAQLGDVVSQNSNNNIPTHYSTELLPQGPILSSFHTQHFH